MAEHPGAMQEGEFDLVGFAVGVVERAHLVTPERMQAGDALIGLPSPGLRSNGYSLARRALLDVGARSLEDPAWEGADRSLADELLLPSVIYAPAVRAVASRCELRGVAHITGGGLPGNVPRMLPPDLDAVMHRSSWEVPRIFGEIALLGGVVEQEMERVFNLGIGMVIAVAGDDTETARQALRGAGHDAMVVGEVVPGSGQLTLAP
jgi:phosphoribosylformylglycinamidine cyclo-ligase